MKKAIYNVIKHSYEFVITFFTFRRLYRIQKIKYENILYAGQFLDIKNLSHKIPNLKRVIDVLCEFARSRKSDQNLCIIDVGAHIGIYSIEFAKNQKNNVLAFEPFTQTFNLLNNNVTNNRFKNIKVFNFGLLDEDKKLYLGAPQHRNKYMKFFKYFDKYSLGSKTIFTNEEINENKLKSDFFKGDDLKVILNSRPIDIIKIDVEGAELKVIQGLKNVIEKDKPVICIESNSGYKNENNDPSLIFKLLNNIGYKNIIDLAELDNLNSFKNAEKINEVNFKMSKSKDLVIY